MKFTAIALLAQLLSSVKAGSWDGQEKTDGLTSDTVPNSQLCDAYEGNVKSLCDTYCNAQACYLGEGTNVVDPVCEQIYDDFVAETGEEPPCTKPCPCFDADTFDGMDLHCGSYDQGSLFVTDSPTATDGPGKPNLIAVANTDSVLSCALYTNMLSDDSGVVQAILSPAQAETCLAVLHGTGCRPFEEADVEPVRE